MAKVWSKDAEREQLQKIAALIEETEPGSYIRMTFAGVCDVCKRNIEDDFGDSPVNDCANMRVAFDAERRMHDETKRQLADLQKMCKEALDLNDKLRKTADECTKTAHDAWEMYPELEEECRAKSQEITRLRAEIMRMKFERMTEFDLATMYEKMEG